MRLDKSEIACLLQGKEPTMAEVAKATAGLTYATLRDRFLNPKPSALAEQVANHQERIDALELQVSHLLAVIANNRLKLGK